MLQLNGNTLAPGYESRLNALSLRLEAMGHPAIGIASGRRSKSLQEWIFRDRYRRQDSGSGPFGDVRWWDGDGDGRRERWVRVKDGGTVLPPGDSTHEDPPATGADLAWPYNNRYTAAHAALVAICEQYGIRWTGIGFGEDWHFDSIWNPYTSFAAGVAAGSTNQPFEEDDMPLTQQDLSAILDAEFQVTQRGTTRAVKLKDALGAVFKIGDILADRIDGVPQNVWSYRLTHPLATVDGKPASVPAGDFLRSEPAEHANTRATIAKVATGNVDVDKLAAEIAARYPQIDVHALAVAAADEADRRDAEEARRRDADRAARDAAGS